MRRSRTHLRAMKTKIFAVAGWLLFAATALLFVNEIKVRDAAPAMVTGYTFNENPVNQTIQAEGTWIGSDMASKVNRSLVVADLQNHVVKITDADILPFSPPLLYLEDDSYEITSITDDTVTAVQKFRSPAIGTNAATSGEIVVIIDRKNKTVHVGKFSSNQDFSYNYQLGDGIQQYRATQKAALVWPLSLLAH